jgi:hypothetical protein
MAPVHAYAANPRRSYQSARSFLSSNERNSFEVTLHRRWADVANIVTKKFRLEPLSSPGSLLLRRFRHRSA